MFIEPKQLEQLRKLQEETGAAIAEHVRRAIDLYLKTRSISKSRK